MHRRLIYFAGRCDHTHIASALGEMARRSRDGGVEVHQTHKSTVIGGMRHAALRRETKECRTILFAHAKSKFLQKYFNRNKFFFAFFITSLVPCDFPSQKANTISE